MAASKKIFYPIKNQNQKKYCQNHGFGQFLDIVGIEKHVLKLGKSMVASDKSFEPILHLSHCSHFSLTHITFSHTYHFFSNFFLRFFCSPLLLTLLHLFCIAFSGTSHFFLYFSQIFLNILLCSQLSFLFSNILYFLTLLPFSNTSLVFSYTSKSLYHLNFSHISHVLTLLPLFLHISHF